MGLVLETSIWFLFFSLSSSHSSLVGCRCQFSMQPFLRRNSFHLLAHLAFLMPGVLSSHSHLSHLLSESLVFLPASPWSSAVFQPPWLPLCRHPRHQCLQKAIGGPPRNPLFFSWITCFFHSGFDFMVKSISKQVFKKEVLLNKTFHLKDFSVLLVGLVSCPREHRIWN